MRSFIEIKVEDNKEFYIDPDEIAHVWVTTEREPRFGQVPFVIKTLKIYLKNNNEKLVYAGDNLVKYFLEQWDEYLKEKAK